MSENWNLEIVADSKSEAPPEKPIEDSARAIPSVLSSDHSLGEIMTMAREARGFSREQAAKASNIPGYYLTMIETDDYSSIADQLYLLPFLRRYAVFVSLEPEEVASRFIREVQRADMNPGRVSEPIEMFAKRRSIPWGTIRMMGALAIVAMGWFGYRYLVARKAAQLNTKAPAVEEQVVVPNASNADAGSPEAADTAAANVEPPPMARAPVAAPSVSIAPASAPAVSVAPAAIASAAVPSPVVSAPVGAAPPKAAVHPAVPNTSSLPSHSSAGHPRSPVKSASRSHHLSMQN